MSNAVPLWVPVVFLLLLALGYRQSATRNVRPGTVVAIALAMLAFSLYGVVSAFGSAPVALLAWALGYALAVVGGARLFASAGMAAAGAFVRVPGSWAPLALVLSIFAAKFALGFAAGVRSPLVHEAWFGGTMAAVLGTLSGGFAARAVAVHRVASTARAV
jgi:hypothetical protein